MLLNKKDIDVLVIEDHFITAEAYGNIITAVANKDLAIKVKIAQNCDDAISQLNQSKKVLVLLDLQLPPSQDEKFICGEDIGLWIRNEYPKTKILIITAISDSERIRSIIKTINPEGFIIKSDIVSMDLLTASQNILNGKKYYSKTIKNFTVNNNNNNNNNNINGHAIDDIDRKILYHLSMGETNINISNLACISKRTVEARKAKLKDLLGITKNCDTNLIKEAKNRNLI